MEINITSFNDVLNSDDLPYRCQIAMMTTLLLQDCSDA
jgi:hypothetical protein